jgi:hypothetical protein
MPKEWAIICVVGSTELISAIGRTCSIEMMNMNPTSRLSYIGDEMIAALVKSSWGWTSSESVKSFEGSSVSFSVFVELALMVVWLETPGECLWRACREARVNRIVWNAATGFFGRRWIC